MGKGGGFTETVGEELVLFVLERDMVSKEVEDTVVECEGDGLPHKLPLDDRLLEICAKGMGSGGSIHMELALGPDWRRP